MTEALLKIIGGALKPLLEIAARLAAFFTAWMWSRREVEKDAANEIAKDARKDAQKWADAGGMSTPDRLRKLAARKKRRDP